MLHNGLLLHLFSQRCFHCCHSCLWESLASTDHPTGCREEKVRLEKLCKQQWWEMELCVSIELSSVNAEHWEKEGHQFPFPKVQNHSTVLTSKRLNPILFFFFGIIWNGISVINISRTFLNFSFFLVLWFRASHKEEAVCYKAGFRFSVIRM